MEEEESKFTANQLLLHYDFAYWLRRLNFIRRKVDALYKLRSFHISELRDDVISEEERIIGRLETISDDQFDYLALPDDQKDVIHQRLMQVRAELRDVYKQLRIEGRKIQARFKEGEKDTIAAKIRAIPLEIGSVRWLLGLPPTSTDHEPDYSKLDEDECLARARELFRKPEFEKAFNDAARVLRKQMMENIVDPTYKKAKALFRPPDPIPDGLSDNDRNWIVIQKYLWRYFSQFDDFDQISFPILYGVEEGESDVVEIIRISPEDATKLINERRERKTSADGVGRRKLAGVALHHFGAFLDRTWRQNDIMWGRLDGAEALVVEHLRHELVLRCLGYQRTTAADLFQRPRGLVHCGKRLQAFSIASRSDQQIALRGHSHRDPVSASRNSQIPARYFDSELRQRGFGDPHLHIRRARVDNFHLRAQDKHRKPLCDRGYEVARKLQQVSPLVRHDEKTREQPSLRRAPAGERGAIGRQVRDVVGELRVQEIPRIGARHREQSVAI